MNKLQQELIEAFKAWTERARHGLTHDEMVELMTEIQALAHGDLAEHLSRVVGLALTMHEYRQVAITVETPSPCVFVFGGVIWEAAIKEEAALRCAEKQIDALPDRLRLGIEYTRDQIEKNGN